MRTVKGAGGQSQRCIQAIEEKFDALDEVLRGVSAILELTPRISDLIVSHGERLSSRIVTAAFRQHGVNAEHVDAREFIITDSEFQKAAPLDDVVEKRTPEKLLPLDCARQSASDGRIYRVE